MPIISESYFNDLEKILMSEVQEILKNKIAKRVVKIQKENINRYVYEQYEPTRYKRRRNSGLLGGATYKSNRTKGFNQAEISVYNKAEQNRKYFKNQPYKNLPMLIEYGHKRSKYLYDSPTSLKFTNPRPFMQHTFNQLDSTDFLRNEMKKELKKIGYAVR